jgi:hypothetical protein
MEGTCEKNGYKKNPRTNFTLSAKRTKIDHTSVKRWEENMKIAIGHHLA